MSFVVVLELLCFLVYAYEDRGEGEEWYEAYKFENKAKQSSKSFVKVKENDN